MLDDPDEPPDEPVEPCPPDAVGFEPLPREVVPVVSAAEPLEPPRVVVLASLRLPLRCSTEVPERSRTLVPTETPERSRTLVPTPTDTPVPVRSRIVRRLRTVTLSGSS